MSRFQARFDKPNNGWNPDKVRNATYLTVGEVYDIDEIVIHSAHTRVYLKDKPEYFNSVCFTFYLDGKAVKKEDEWDFFTEAGANTWEFECDEDS